MNKVKDSFKILIFGIVSQIVTLLMGILIPKLLIVNYGSEINGLLSSIKQIFVYVALLEAGIGTASLQALYEPVAKDDKDKISEIMSATNIYYKRTALLYGIAVLIIAVLYPLITKSDVPFYIAFGIIILQGSSGVINFLFQGKYSILLRVEGKAYITTNASTIVNIASKVAQIVLILLGFNILCVQFAYFIISLLQILYINRYISKNYPWLNLRSTPDYPALSQSKNVIIHQISGLIFNNTDIIILTYACGLKVVSVYSLYALIVGCISTLIDTIASSVEFILGQAFNSDKNKFIILQETYETYYLGLSFSLFTATYLLLLPFMKLYVGDIDDVNYIDDKLPLLFVVLNVLMYARRTSSQIINFAGHFKQTQWRSILESAINLTSSLILVRYIGIYGVLIGTILALLYRTNDIIIYANRRILHKSPKNTYRRWIQNTALMVVIVMTIKKEMNYISSYYNWLISAIIVSLLCLFVFFILDSLFDKTCFKYVINYIHTCFSKKFNTNRK